MKLSKIADSVFAAFVSCRFSCDFFFFFAARGTGFGLAKFFVIIFAFNGIRISGACDNLRLSGKPEFSFTLMVGEKNKKKQPTKYDINSFFVSILKMWKIASGIHMRQT